MAVDPGSIDQLGIDAPAGVVAVHYTYNSDLNECVDESGIPGYNKDLVGTCSDFSGKNLAQADFSNQDLRGANFEKASLVEAKLDNANLEGANLSYTDLTGASMKGTVLKQARTRGTIMPTLPSPTPSPTPQSPSPTPTSTPSPTLPGSEINDSDSSDQQAEITPSPTTSPDLETISPIDNLSELLKIELENLTNLRKTRQPLVDILKDTQRNISEIKKYSLLPIEEEIRVLEERNITGKDSKKEVQKKLQQLKDQRESLQGQIRNLWNERKDERSRLREINSKIKKSRQLIRSLREKIYRLKKQKTTS